MSRILLTGAGGHLGQVLRDHLAGAYELLRVSDRTDLEDLGPGEEFVQCDLADPQAVLALVEGCDAIIHLGGMSIESTFDIILNSNIVGTYNIYEAARKQGVKRVVFASSNHATGFHARDTKLDAESPLRADSLYGVSKGFGEILGRYYFDKFGIETVCIRIGYCFEKPEDRRTMHTWLSFRDFSNLVKTSIEAEKVDYTIVYGTSANEELWWNNHKAQHLGWTPQDSSQEFAKDPDILADTRYETDPAFLFQGGAFVGAGHFED